MQKPLIAAMIMVLALGGCGAVRESRMNPMNWFGRSNVETLAPAGGWTTTADRRALIPVVTDLEVLRTPEGAIIQAAGQTATQGWWDVELRPTNDGRPVDGALVYEFVVAAPLSPAAVGSEASRHVTAAVKVSNRRLEGVRQVIVRGAQNQRQVNR